MTRCEAFYRKVKQLQEAQNFEGLEAFCQKDSQVTLWRINNYIDFCDRYSLPMGKIAERALRPLIAEPNVDVQDKVIISVKEKLVTQKVEEKDVIAMLNEAKGVPHPSEHGIGSEPAYKEPRNEIQTENIPLITKSPSSQDTSILPEDVQKEVDETIIRARLSKEEALDLVKVVKETPREELSRTLMTPRAAIMMYHAAKKPRPEPEAREWKPKEKPEQRVAIMHPQKSRMETEVIFELMEEGLPLVVGREYCLQSTTPDAECSKSDLVIYIDGPVHEGREDRDDRLRELLMKRHGKRVLALPYESDSEATKEELKRKIREAMKE